MNVLYKLIAGALVAFFIAGRALAQNAGTVTNHAFAIGKGAGVAGYTSLLCGSAQLAVGQAAADPICKTITGDVTLSAAGAITLGTVNSNVGSFGSATQCATITVNAKGLITAASAATCTPAIGSITGLGTGVATALAINIGSAGAPVTFNGAGGTPSSMVGTNITSLNASNLASGTVAAARMPALTGACTTSAGAVATTCLINTQISFGGATNSINAGTTGWEGIGLQCSASEAVCQVPMANAGTIKNLYAKSGSAPGGTDTYVFTLRKNASSQSLTCTITGAATQCNDTTHSFSVVAGDLVDVQITSSATAASLAVSYSSLTLVTTSP